MILKGIIDEDFINYKKPAMVLEFPYCSFKCDKECGMQVCQNSALALAPKIEVPTEEIVNRYINNPIVEAIVMQGLEPLDSWFDVINFIRTFREKSDDDIVIYTGYTESETCTTVQKFYKYRNIYIKFGRFIPNQKPHYDEVLGVNLASDNQYGKKIS
jgi:hypothetical protein